MTPIEQHAFNKKAHEGVPFLIDLLSFWEAVSESKHEPLADLRGNVGTPEVRDLCISIHPYTDAVWKSYTEQFGEFEDAFDWEFCPLLVTLIPWDTADYNRVPGQYFMTLDLPPAEEMAKRVHARHKPDLAEPIPDVVGRVEAAMRDDADGDSERILNAYAAADDATKKVVDDIFISLCGYSLETLTKQESPTK